VGQVDWAALLTKRPRIPAEVRALMDEARRLEGSPAAPKGHHYVPSSYLARWAEGGLLRRTDVVEHRDRKMSPKQAGKEKAFYRLESEDLDPASIPPLMFEVLLGKVENWGKPAIDELVKPDGRLSGDAVARFAVFLAMQATRGVGMREEINWAANAIVQQQFKDISDEGIVAMLNGQGREATEAEIAKSREGFDALMAGDLFVRPQKAATVGQAAQMTEQLTEHFLGREWVVFKTSRVLVTSDEPIVGIGGPGCRRDERAGLGVAGVVVYPLDPAHLLAMFRPDVARRLRVRWRADAHALGELDHGDTAEINREIAMAAHRWTFERPTKRVVARMTIPPRPEAGAIEESEPVVEGDTARSLLRFYKPTRWITQPSTPWPVPWWWS
jgi:hypothetical protein